MYMYMSGRTGARYERQLVSRFQDEGYFARRAGGSGGGSDDDSYDVIAAKDGNVYVVELKYRDGNSVYVDAAKGNALKRIAAAFGGTPLIAARYKQDTTYHFFTPSSCRRTDSGTYTVHKSMRENSMRLVG